MVLFVREPSSGNEVKFKLTIWNWWSPPSGGSPKKNLCLQDFQLIFDYLNADTNESPTLLQTGFLFVKCRVSSAFSHDLLCRGCFSPYFSERRMSGEISRAPTGYNFNGQRWRETSSCSLLQGSVERWAPGWVNFVPAVAYHFCLNLPTAFTQPEVRLLSEPCTASAASGSRCLSRMGR